jgi:hypothetical protein
LDLRRLCNHLLDDAVTRYEESAMREMQHDEAQPQSERDESQYSRGLFGGGGNGRHVRPFLPRTE